MREFVSEFRGLSSTAKQTEATGDLKGVYLHDLVGDGDIDMGRVEGLLEAMKRLSKAPKPAALGCHRAGSLKKVDGALCRRG